MLFCLSLTVKRSDVKYKSSQYSPGQSSNQHSQNRNWNEKSVTERNNTRTDLLWQTFSNFSFQKFAAFGIESGDAE